MDLYAQPYVGMHFVSPTPIKSIGRVVLEIARAMPDVERQTKSMYMSWDGRSPFTSEPPLRAVKMHPSPDQMTNGFDDTRLSPDAIDAAIEWVEKQDTRATAVLRWLPTSEEDGYRHAAWLVTGAAPFADGYEEAPHTELSAVCLAEPIVARHAREQTQWVQGVLEAVAASPTAWEYGYVEIGDWSEILEGGAYQATMGNLLRWRQMLEYNVWQAHGMLPSGFNIWREKYPVKGVYWGNYFGPRVLERIGGTERIKAHIDERCKEDPRNGWYRDMPGGALFLALSDRISDALYLPGGGQSAMRAMTNAVWLWSVLREANVML